MRKDREVYHSTCTTLSEAMICDVEKRKQGIFIEKR
jgi:hypothetical protein